MDAIKTLNIDRKYFRDLMTDVPFAKADILTIQDPLFLTNRNLNTFSHIKSSSRSSPSSSDGGADNCIKPNHSIQRILDNLKSDKKHSSLEEESKRLELTSSNCSLRYHSKPVDCPASTPMPTPRVVSSVRSQGKVAASFTSTSMTLVTDNKLTQRSEEVYRRLKSRRLM